MAYHNNGGYNRDYSGHDCPRMDFSSLILGMLIVDKLIVVKILKVVIVDKAIVDNVYFRYPF